ncbi:hypothetical protein D3C80_1771280 [compost metagenome]
MLHTNLIKRNRLLNDRAERFNYFSFNLDPAVDFGNRFLDCAFELFINGFMRLLLNQVQ